MAWSGARGLDDIAAGAALTPDTRFGLGWVRKHITALTALTLVEDDTVDLDATVADYVPASATRPESGRVRRAVNLES